MALLGRPCRALACSAFLAGDDAEIERKAVNMEAMWEGNPGGLAFMDASAGAPFGGVDPFAECADWLHDADRGRWEGWARDEDDEPFAAPLFAFWLAQALACCEKARSAPVLFGIGPDGRKAPLPGRADLGWDWRSASEPRLELLAAAFGAREEAERGAGFELAASLSHPLLARAYARSSAQAFARLCGSGPSLSSLLDARELARVPKAPPSPLRARL